ncbi:MAG: hypothetical protein ABSC03_06700 [Verrucomicrobiota bacterium]
MTHRTGAMTARVRFLTFALILALPGLARAGLIDFSWVAGQQQVPNNTVITNGLPVGAQAVFTGTSGAYWYYINNGGMESIYPDAGTQNNIVSNRYCRILFQSYDPSKPTTATQPSYPVTVDSFYYNHGASGLGEQSDLQVEGWLGGVLQWSAQVSANQIGTTIVGAGISVDEIRAYGRGYLLDNLVVNPAVTTGDITFAEYDGTTVNTPLPPGEYDGGLPVGLAAMWNGWLFDVMGANEPVSIFVNADLPDQYDASIIFSEPVTIPSLQVYRPSGSSALYIIGRRNGQRLWSYTSTLYNTWLTVTNGSGEAIDQLAVEGKWNHLDDIVVTVVPPANVVTNVPRVSIRPVAVAPGKTPGMEVSWYARTGQVFQVESATQLSAGSWTATGSAVVGTGVTNVMVDTNLNDQAGFYRLNAAGFPPDEVDCETERAINGLPTPPTGFKWAVFPNLTDEFNLTNLDMTKWTNLHPYWTGRAPSQFFATNVSLANGKLILRQNSLVTNLLQVADPNNDIWIGSACVAFRVPLATNGFYEAKIKVSTVCMANAFWFQGNSTEIDVIENFGWPINRPGDLQQMLMNTHYFPNGWNYDANTPTQWTMPTRGGDEYHIYGVWWKDANNVWMYHNGQRVATITTGGPFTVPQYMFFDQEAFTWEGLPTVESLQDRTRNAMYVDWVHAWRLIPQ